MFYFINQKGTENCRYPCTFDTNMYVSFLASGKLKIVVLCVSDLLFSLLVDD